MHHFTVFTVFTVFTTRKSSCGTPLETYRPRRNQFPVLFWPEGKYAHPSWRVSQSRAGWGGTPVLSHRGIPLSKSTLTGNDWGTPLKDMGPEAGKGSGTGDWGTPPC